MAGRVGRIAAVTAMVATGTGAAMFGAGTANAASNPLIVGGCDKAVSAQAGQAVKVDASGLLGQAVPPVYLGDAPSGGTSTMSVPTSKLVKTVRGVPLLGGLLSQVTGVIGPTCDVTVRVVNAVHAPVADSPVTDTTRHTGNSLRPVTRPVTTGVDKTTRGLLSDPANPGGGGGGGGTTPPGGGGGGGGNPNPGGGGGGGNNGGGKSPVLPNNPGGPGGNLAFYPPPLSPGGFGAFGNVFGPGARYGNLPFVTSGVFNPGQAGFGQQVPGFSPQFGNLNGEANDSVQNAGQAEAFGPSDAGNDVGLPLLVAVLALSGAGASLVRTWVLRRAS